MLTDGTAVVNALGVVLFLTMIVFDLTLLNVLYFGMLFCYFVKFKFF